MEYQIYRLVRNRYKIPYIIRIIAGSICFLLSIPPIIIPFPGSIFVGVFLFVISVLLFISANRIRHLIKIRKGIIYLFTHLNSWIIVRHKIRNFSTHIRKILEDKKQKKFGHR